MSREVDLVDVRKFRGPFVVEFEVDDGKKGASACFDPSQFRSRYVRFEFDSARGTIEAKEVSPEEEKLLCGTSNR